VSLPRPGPAAALALGAALALAAPAAAAPPHPDERTVRERLEDVYSRPALRHGRDASPGWLQRQLRALLEWLGGLRGKAPVAFWLLIFLCGLALGALLLFLFHRVRRAFYVGEAATPGRAERAERQQLSLAFREEAGRRAARGEFTEAVRFLFLSLVYHFDESGRVLFRQSATNREYLGLLADRPEVAGGLRVFVDALDEHWYGERPADERQYRDCLALFESLSRQGGERGAWRTNRAP